MKNDNDAFYIRTGRSEKGPFKREHVAIYLKRGEISPETLVRQDGSSTPITAKECVEGFGVNAAEAAPAPEIQKGTEADAGATGSQTLRSRIGNLWKSGAKGKLVIVAVLLLIVAAIGSMMEDASSPGRQVGSRSGQPVQFGGITFSDDIRSTLEKLSASPLRGSNGQLPRDPDSGDLWVSLRERSSTGQSNYFGPPELSATMLGLSAEEAARSGISTIEFTEELASPQEWIRFAFMRNPEFPFQHQRDIGSGSDDDLWRYLMSAASDMLAFTVSLDEYAMREEEEPIANNSVYQKLVERYGSPDEKYVNPRIKADRFEVVSPRWEDRLGFEAKWDLGGESIHFLIYSDIGSISYECHFQNSARIRALHNELPPVTSVFN